jgi:hypothetical protein
MAIKWFNIRSREVAVAETEPQITAMWASSDHSPNITQGQDFGWRLAPEVVVEMKRIKQDEERLMFIAKKYNRPLEDVGEPEILQYISDKTAAANAPIAQEGDYTDEYAAEIRRLDMAQEPTAEQLLNAPQTATTTTTESLADLERRVALEERLAAARAVPATSTETTTTTEKQNPTTTTTTTKKQ